MKMENFSLTTPLTSSEISFIVFCIFKNKRKMWEIREKLPKKKFQRLFLFFSFFFIPSTSANFSVGERLSRRSFSQFYHRHRSHACGDERKNSRRSSGKDAKTRRKREKSSSSVVRIAKLVSLWTVQCSTIIKIYYHSVSFRLAFFRRRLPLAGMFPWFVHRCRLLFFYLLWVKVLFAHASVDT